MAEGVGLGGGRSVIGPAQTHGPKIAADERRNVAMKVRQLRLVKLSMDLMGGSVFQLDSLAETRRRTVPLGVPLSRWQCQ